MKNNEVLNNNQRFLYYLLFIFSTTILLILVLQYNSNENINRLIKGNESLLNEFVIIGETQKMQTDMLYIESEIHRTVIGEDSSYLPGIRSREKSVREELKKVKPLISNDSTQKILNKLDSLIAAKLDFGDIVLSALFTKGQTAAENLYKSRKGKNAMGEIVSTIDQVNRPRRAYFTQLSNEADENGHKARRWGFIMAITAVSTCLFALWNIQRRIKRRQILFDKLHASEMKAREAGVMKENFMANISHEIRTPMNAILGFTNLLQKETLSDKAKHFVTSIQTSGENLLTIINDVLDFSKIEAGMMRIESNAFGLRGLLHSVETMFVARAAAKKLQLTTTVNPAVPDLLKGDAVRLTQIVVNLVNNAVKFTNSGSIEIKVSYKNKKDDSVDIILSVKDTGIGIAPDKIAGIFDRFQQGDEDTTRKYGGTGLGLSIVKQLAELQHGRIEVTSLQNMGTEFTVTIPYLIAAGSAQIQHDVVSAQNPGGANSGIKILVVEDNLMNQNLMRHLMTDWKLDFAIVNNGREAVDILAEKKFSLVLMDIQMPELDGYSATEKIRNTLKLDIPIIAMTAHAMAGEREKCLAAGMNEYVSKPIRESELFKIMHELLQRPARVFPQTNDAAAGQLLDLDYLSEIAGGNKTFERDMLEQFVEQLPGELHALKQYMDQGDIVSLAAAAHNMKTTISFMGLSPIMSADLDFIEAGTKNTTGMHELSERIVRIEMICKQALQEAHQYLAL